MTIRSRLTWWYGVLLVLLLALMGGLIYEEWLERNEPDLLEEGPDSALEEVSETLFRYGLPAALVLLAGGWVLLGKAMAPVTALTQAAERIDLDNLKERLPATGRGDELERLTGVFNAMMTRLEDSYARVQNFTLNASHELKTPLAIMKIEIESRLRRDPYEPPEREHLESQLDEIQRLTRIVDGLSLLSKADFGQAALRREPVPLDELVKESYADAEMLARSQQIEVELIACDEVTVFGDRHRLRQLLLNLTDNTIKHNQPQGQITISLTRQGGAAELKIANTGAGIPSDKLPRVFDRFYRGDSAQSKGAEGCGLGLSIAAWIVKAHGGDIRMTSEQGGLTMVELRIPASGTHGKGQT